MIEMDVCGIKSDISKCFNTGNISILLLILNLFSLSLQIINSFRFEWAIVGQKGVYI